MLHVTVISRLKKSFGVLEARVNAQEFALEVLLKRMRESEQAIKECEGCQEIIRENTRIRASRIERLEAIVEKLESNATTIDRGSDQLMKQSAEIFEKGARLSDFERQLDEVRMARI